MLSHWLTEAGLSPEDAAPAIEGDERADICIVGGGFCGLWTAIRLKQRDPSVDIAIIEKDLCGSGASGRNGGFVLSWWAKFGSLSKFCASDEAIRLARASADAVGEIGRFCADNGIDAHYRGDGWLWAASNEAQDGSWDRAARYPGAPPALPLRALGAGDGPASIRDRAARRRHLRAHRRQRAAGPAGARAAPDGTRHGGAHLRADADEPPRPHPAAPRGHAARHGDGGEGGHRHERLVDHVPGAAAHHRRGRERHRGRPGRCPSSSPPRAGRTGCASPIPAPW